MRPSSQDPRCAPALSPLRHTVVRCSGSATLQGPGRREFPRRCRCLLCGVTFNNGSPAGELFGVGPATQSSPRRSPCGCSNSAVVGEKGLLVGGTRTQPLRRDICNIATSSSDAPRVPPMAEHCFATQTLERRSDPRPVDVARLKRRPALRRGAASRRV